VPGRAEDQAAVFQTDPTRQIKDSLADRDIALENIIDCSLDVTVRYAEDNVEARTLKI